MTMEAKAMDIKKLPPTAASAPNETSFSGKRLTNFFGEVKEEFGKISWTDPQELRAYTKIVVSATFILGLGIYVIDLCIQSALGLLGLAFHSLFG